MTRCNNGNTLEMLNIKIWNPPISPVFLFISLEGYSLKQTFIYVLYLTILMLHVSKMDELHDLDMKYKRSMKKKE
jgi:hypothetical protein